MRPFVEQNVLSRVPMAWRRGAAYRENLRLLDESLPWDAERLRTWRLGRVRAVVAHAEAHVPYYRELFGRIGFSSRDLRSLDDLAAIPPITKEEVKEHRDRLLSERIAPERVFPMFTGGSTGEPMSFFVDRDRSFAELSFFAWIWRRYGHDLGRDRVVFVKADRAPAPDRKVFFRHDRYFNYLRCDSNFLNLPENFPYYDRAIRAFGAPVLFGYPSSIYQLARMYELAGDTAPRFRLVLLASENVYAWQQELIRRVFGPDRIFFHYGHSEMALLAFQCPDDDRLQLVPQYGHAELLDEKGDAVTRPGELGELVGTALSLHMPFLRYRTRDYATLSANQSGLFADGIVIDAVEGRLQEFIVTRDRRLVSVCTIGGYHFPQMQMLLHIQYYQDEPGVLTLRYVESPGRALSDAERRDLVTAFESALYGQITLRLERVEEIALSRSNKKSMLVQRLEVERYLGA